MIVFPQIWIKELSIFDLRFGFYVKNYPYSLIPRSIGLNLGQNTFKLIF